MWWEVPAHATVYPISTCRFLAVFAALSLSPSLRSRLSVYRQGCALRTGFRLQSTDLPGYTRRWAVKQDVWISPRHNGFVKAMLRQTDGEESTAKVEGAPSERAGCSGAAGSPQFICAAASDRMNCPYVLFRLSRPSLTLLGGSISTLKPSPSVLPICRQTAFSICLKIFCGGEKWLPQAALKNQENQEEEVTTSCEKWLWLKRLAWMLIW